MRTWVDLRSPCSRSNLHASRRKFFIFWTPNPIQRNSSSYSNLLASEIRDIGQARSLGMFFFLRLACTCTQSLGASSTCESVLRWFKTFKILQNCSVYEMHVPVQCRLASLMYAHEIIVKYSFSLVPECIAAKDCYGDEIACIGGVCKCRDGLVRHDSHICIPGKTSHRAYRARCQMV